MSPRIRKIIAGFRVLVKRMMKFDNHELLEDRVLPTKAVISEHFPLRLIYGSWWAVCVAGQTRMAQHLVAKVTARDQESPCTWTTCS